MPATPETITLYSANQILAEALARHLVTSHTTRKYVYTTLIEYIARTLAHRPRARCSFKKSPQLSHQRAPTQALAGQPRLIKVWHARHLRAFVIRKN